MVRGALETERGLGEGRLLSATGAPELCVSFFVSAMSSSRQGGAWHLGMLRASAAITERRLPAAA